MIDILVNNAGIIKRIPMTEMSVEDFKQVIDIDLNAPFIVSKAVLPGMIKKGHGKITGREYHCFSYYGAEDAENIIILMGSATEAAREAIDYLTSEGKKVGMISVHLYRPFSVKHLFAAVPKTVKKIAVLDRTKEPGAEGEPLYLDVKSAFYDQENRPVIVGGRYGLGSSDITPAKIISVYNNLELPEPKNHFTVGNNSASVVADAYLSGLRGYDMETLWQAGMIYVTLQ